MEIRVSLILLAFFLGIGNILGLYYRTILLRRKLVLSPDFQSCYLIRFANAIGNGIICCAICSKLVTYAFNYRMSESSVSSSSDSVVGVTELELSPLLETRGTILSHGTVR